jgi:hypothetical protein
MQESNVWQWLVEQIAAYTDVSSDVPFAALLLHEDSQVRIVGCSQLQLMPTACRQPLLFKQFIRPSLLFAPFDILPSRRGNA